MALETVPAGRASDGNGTVWFVPTIANPAAPTAAEINAGTRITYSLTGDGFAHAVTENRVTANRLTLKQTIQYAGTITDEVELTYVAAYDEDDVARTVLVEGVSGYIVTRWGVDNAVNATAADIVTVIPGTAGVQRPNPPATNQELTISQLWNVSGSVKRNVAVTAGV